MDKRIIIKLGGWRVRWKDGWMRHQMVDLSFPQQFCDVGIIVRILQKRKWQLRVVMSLTQSQVQVIEQVGVKSGFQPVSQTPKTLSKAPSRHSPLPGSTLSSLASHSRELFWQALVRLRDGMGIRDGRTISFQRLTSWKHWIKILLATDGLEWRTGQFEYTYTHT